MKKKYKGKNSLFNTILIAVCSFVGVGFVTGAEIWFYFARFETSSVVGVAVFGTLIFVLSWFCANTSASENTKISRIKNKISIFGEMAVASAMISGLFETTREIFQNWWLIVFALAIVLIIFLYFSEKKSFLIYNYFVAIFVVFAIISLFAFNNYDMVNFEHKSSVNFGVKNAFLSCIFACIYVFSNIAELRPIIEKNSRNNSKKDNFKLSLFLSLTLIFLVVVFEILMLKHRFFSKFSMPFLMVFKEKNGWLLWAFLVGVVLTMISTAEACLIGVKDKLKFQKNDEIFIKTIVIISSLIIGQIPFKFFIKIIYPTVAVLNFLIFLIEIFEVKKSSKLKT